MEGNVRKRVLEKSDSIPTDDIIHGIDEKIEEIINENGMSSNKVFLTRCPSSSFVSLASDLFIPVIF